jgi:hypothetical protein
MKRVLRKIIEAIFGKSQKPQAGEVVFQCTMPRTTSTSAIPIPHIVRQAIENLLQTKQERRRELHEELTRTEQQIVELETHLTAAQKREQEHQHFRRAASAYSR